MNAWRRPGVRDPAATPRRFGTFGGVFTPCTLTILGVIMFLRFGQVVGNAGVWSAVAIVLIAKTITSLTSLSLSAIATNTRVQGGGAYYLISRSLGVEFGGAIGLVFFLAQAVSVAMYVIGFAEAFVGVFPDVGLSVRDVATAVNLVIFVCVYAGAGWAIKLQYGILAALGAALLSFFVGAAEHARADVLAANLWPGYAGGENFFTMFALFFPAATGIMAGANMSGDLRSPARSIPLGTLTSILVTGVIYVAMAVMLGAAADRATLLGDPLVVRTVAAVTWMIPVGIFAATLSSGLGSMMGAPRILQALGRDQVFKRLSFFGPGSGAENEPRRATVLTFLVAQAAILAGDLDAIAPVITMFFMITYGYLNLATFYESIIRNPSYRPTFRFSHWSTALLGAVSCLGVMFLIEPLWAIVSIAAMGGLHLYLGRKEILATWGDVTSGAAFERARRSLLRLEEEVYHPKNWRPAILALSGSAWRRVHLAVYAHWLTGGRGLLTLGQVIRGDIRAHLARRRNQESALRTFIQQQDLAAFPVVVVAPSLDTGIEALVQCHGIGSLYPNVVLLGWSTDPERVEDFGDNLRTIAAMGRSMVLIHAPSEAEDPWLPPEGPVDVWWRGKDNGGLLVLFAHLLVQNPAWRGRHVRLLRMITAEAGREEATRHLTRLLADARVEAEPVVVVDRDFPAALRRVSAEAAVVLLGFQPPAEEDAERFVDGMTRLMEGLGTVVLVRSAGDVALEA